ncbi:MAG TPA: YtxH domain-containing protein [Bdellovibrionales bacterium]|nr:YtxH domain-containing protein [Bdellovibrionales bacterium]
MNLSQFSGMNKHDIMKSLGVEPEYRDAWFGVAGLSMFGLGLLIGAGVGLLFAPRAGTELRSELQNRFGGMKGQDNISGSSDFTSASDISGVSGVSGGSDQVGTVVGGNVTSSDLNTGAI